jgi:hypothetical protein
MTYGKNAIRAEIFSTILGYWYGRDMASGANLKGRIASK